MSGVSLGIAGLDKLIGGGLKEGSNILFTGYPGTSKSLFIHKIVYSMLERGFTVIFVSTDRSSKHLIDEVKNLGMNYAKYIKSKNLMLIDVYAGKAALDSSFSVDIRDLTKLSLLVDEVLSGLDTKKVIQVYDVLTELFIWTNNNESIIQFISNACSRTRDNGAVSFFVINEGAKGQEYINSIKSVTDGVISFGLDNDKRFLKIEKMKGSPVGTGKHYFKINPSNGVITFAKPLSK